MEHVTNMYDKSLNKAHILFKLCLSSKMIMNNLIVFGWRTSYE